MDAAHSWVIAPGALESWLTRAVPADRLVYAVGPSLPQGTATVCMVSELVALGKLRTHVVRNPETKALEHVAVRREADAPEPGETPPADDPRGAGRRMMQLLNRAALTGRPCPTNAELAEALGLKNKMAAQSVFQQLVRSGKIRVADFGPRMRRVVTISATGNSTRKGVAV